MLCAVCAVLCAALWVYFAILRAVWWRGGGVVVVCFCVCLCVCVGVFDYIVCCAFSVNVLRVVGGLTTCDYSLRFVFVC